jgi:peptidoglycan/xylan/chitin deacetylase (PgdA/CDA1 family)
MMRSDHITVLMYHAVLAGMDDPQGADPHYAVTAETMRCHLALIKSTGRQAISVASLLEDSPHGEFVAVTFDDGHVSNYEQAAPLLLETGSSADFFVNPSTVDTPGHISWAGLRDMAAGGLSVQSHGYTHRYFDDMSQSEIDDELAKSKREIEDRLGQPVTLFAPPGGRLSPLVGDIAQRLGYKAICSSRPGRWRGQSREIPRMAILASTSDVRLQKWLSGDWVEMSRSRLRYSGTRILKRALGNRNYERFRESLLARLS